MYVAVKGGEAAIANVQKLSNETIRQCVERVMIVSAGSNQSECDSSSKRSM